MRLPRSAIATIGAATALAVAILVWLPPRAREPRKALPLDETTNPMPPETAPPAPIAVLPAPPRPTQRAARPDSAPALPQPPELPDDASILTQLHDLAASDPEQSLRLARSALERSPSGASAPEFDWNVVKALYNLRRIEEATDEARTMVRNYPESDFSADVVRHLLNPQPNP
jgi:hypothetical protein